MRCFAERSFGFSWSARRALSRFETMELISMLAVPSVLGAATWNRDPVTPSSPYPYLPIQYLARSTNQITIQIILCIMGSTTSWKRGHVHISPNLDGSWMREKLKLARLTDGWMTGKTGAGLTGGGTADSDVSVSAAGGAGGGIIGGADLGSGGWKDGGTGGFDSLLAGSTGTHSLSDWTKRVRSNYFWMQCIRAYFLNYSFFKGFYTTFLETYANCVLNISKCRSVYL